MKTRTSLVSNSSSASFIVHRNIYYTATRMWDCVSSSWEEFDKKWKDKCLKEIKKVCEREDVLSGKIGISFPSTNEETYILFKNKMCYVQTSNNHNWWEFVDGIGKSSDFLEEVENELKDKLFCHIRVKKLLSRDQFEIPKNLRQKLVCPECKKYAHENGWDYVNSDTYIIDSKGNKYCSMHYLKLQEVSQNPTNETPKE